MPDISPDQIAASVIVLFLGIGIHEFAHCKVADMAGDPTPRYYGRVTLNLFKHFEPVGTLMMVISSFTGVGLGWGRPAPINPAKMRNPRWDTFAAVAAGPVSNFLQACVYAIILRLLILGHVDFGGFVGLLLLLGVHINLGLMLFNLIPFGPLDGHWLVGQCLPEPQRHAWYQFNRTVGVFGLLIIITVLNQIAKGGGPDVLGILIGTPRDALFRFLTGLS